MSNPYFAETTIDGTPRRPLVERESSLRDEDGNFGRGLTLDHPYGRIELKLTRLAVIEWLHDSPQIERPHDLWEALQFGATDDKYNELAHRLLDAMKVEP